MVYSTPANDIFVVRRDGTDLRKLVTAEDHNMWVGGFAWSPDGAIIRFSGGDNRLWEVSPDGSVHYHAPTFTHFNLWVTAARPGRRRTRIRGRRIEAPVRELR